MYKFLKLLTKIIFIGFFFSQVSLITNTHIAGADDIISDEQLKDGTRKTIRLLHNDGVKYREYYKTWDVVGVTEDTIFLERTKNKREVVKANIERSRRPSLQVGDRVRYDKKRNRLRKTLDK